MIKIYGFAASSYVRSARMAAFEKGVDHELRAAPEGLKAESYRAFHPWQKMPVLEHGDVRIYETSAICTYLDAAFAGPSLLPTDAVSRARAMQWVSNLNCYVYPHAVRDYALKYIFPAETGPDRKAIDEAAPKVTRALAVLDDAIGDRPFVAGPTFSIADVMLAPAVATVVRFPEAERALSDAPNVARWLKAISGRDSFQKIHEGLA